MGDDEFGLVTGLSVGGWGVFERWDGAVPGKLC